jgi:ribosomal protein S18 acetylase RimI-like enzyme
MSEGSILIEKAVPSSVAELARLYIAYRLFYGEPPEQVRSLAFIRERVMFSESDTPVVARYFIASMPSPDGPRAVGFMHLMPSTNTLAMRPIWLLEDLYVDPSARGQGVATSLLKHAEEFARSTGAERLTLATAHDNLAAQSIYKKLGYLREEHFGYFHRLLP